MIQKLVFFSDGYRVIYDADLEPLFMRCEEATLAECPVRARWHFYIGPLEIRRHR